MSSSTKATTGKVPSKINSEKSDVLSKKTTAVKQNSGKKTPSSKASSSSVSSLSSVKGDSKPKKKIEPIVFDLSDIEQPAEDVIRLDKEETLDFEYEGEDNLNEDVPDTASTQSTLNDEEPSCQVQESSEKSDSDGEDSHRGRFKSERKNVKTIKTAKKEKGTLDKLPPSGIYRINPKMYNEMFQGIVNKGYERREIEKQPQGRFRMKWFCKLYFCSESPIKNAMKSLAYVDDIEDNKTSRHILIFYQEETPEDGVEAKKIKNVFAKCFGHAHNVIKKYVDQEFSFDIGKRQVDMEKIIRYSHTNLFGPIHSLEVKLREEGNPIQICPYYVVNSITGEMEVEIEDATNEKKKRKCKVQISESNLKLFKYLTMEQHCHFLNYLLACSEKIPIYDYQYQFMSREKGTNRIRKLEELLEDRVKLMIGGADGSSHPVKDVSVVLNGGDLDALGGKICLLIKRSKKTNILKSVSIHPRIVEIEKILSNVKDKSLTPRDIYFEYNVRHIPHQEQLLDCIQCHLFIDNKAYFKEGKRWLRTEGDFLRHIRWKFQDLMDELLIPDDDENFLPLPCLEILKRAENEDTQEKQEKEIMDILRRTNVKSACCDFLKLISAEDSKRENVDHVLESRKIEWVPPFFGPKVIERAIMKLDLESRKYLEDAFGKEEFNLFHKFFTAIKKEEDYNRMYIDLQNLCPSLGYIVGDQIEIRKIELFDILKIPKRKSGGELHLYHVKRNFDVSSVRAVVSQIKNSAEFLQRSLYEDTLQLKKYYNLLIQSNKRSKEKSSSTDTFRGRVAKIVHKLIPTAEEFIEMFQNNTLVFVYAFTDHLLSRTKYCSQVSELGCMANRKLEMMNVKDDETSTRKKDNFVISKEERKALLKGGYLIESDGALSINERAFRNEKNRIEEHFVSVLRDHGLNNELRMKKIFKAFEDRLCPLRLDSTGSCIDLLKLKTFFTHNYPKFRLKICQIKRPWYWADGRGKDRFEGTDSQSEKETTDENNDDSNEEYDDSDGDVTDSVENFDDSEEDTDSFGKPSKLSARKNQKARTFVEKNKSNEETDDLEEVDVSLTSEERGKSVETNFKKKKPTSSKAKEPLGQTTVTTPHNPSTIKTPMDEGIVSADSPCTETLSELQEIERKMQGVKRKRTPYADSEEDHEFKKERKEIDEHVSQ